MQAVADESRPAAPDHRRNERRRGPTASSRTPLEAALEACGERTRWLVVWHLFWGARPFCDLLRSTPGTSAKELRRALAEMERHGLIRRTVRFWAGRRAEYSLTPLGETLKLIVGSLYEWGLKFRGPFAITDGAPSGAREGIRSAFPGSPTHKATAPGDVPGRTMGLA